MVRVTLANRNQVMTDIVKKIRKLKNQKSLTNTRVARFLQLNAKSLAPVRSGKLVNSIRILKLKNGGRSVAVTAGQGIFPYPKWVNQSKGFTKLRFPNGGPHGLKPGDVAIYGISPAHWNWTGKPRFFRTAIQRTKKEFMNIAVKGYNKALGAKIGGA